MRQIRVAVVGAGPAGIYAADILANEYRHAQVDVFDRLPTPFGLVRYGVAPDHPRIKEIIKALRRVLTRTELRFIGNVHYGTDIKLSDLRHHYDAIIFATGARADRNLDIPGIDLPGSYGAAEFVSWYDGHPDVPREWPLNAKNVAVLGAGNVALDIARVLAKPADEQLTTEIPDNVYRGLAGNHATDVHVFARRGPAQIKFTPMEFRELSHSPNVDVVVHPDGFEIDDASQRAINSNKSTRLVVDTLFRYMEMDPTDASRRIHIHLCQAPVAILGTEHVEGLRTERTELLGNGTVGGTGDFTDWPVQAVYRAVGYLSSHLADLPFDHHAGIVPHDAGRVLDMDGAMIDSVYVTGWIKRGPVGLIGHTKSDAAETIASLLADLPGLRPPVVSDRDAILACLSQNGIDYTTWEEWERLDLHEMALGKARGRERIKVVPRREMISAGRT
ncbi:FAD-dependent oxidoreductase [Mycobacterium montefiorense]|uniref:ferredoxin--NADP(+) reductase n=2 Tax=Mycobacterium montefiorense TaxID=154654 RepID=A0ABQ0NMI3_9MYCO|nr:FAD-dependent oxidoreductase [Mycobacterium montefiorense]GBG38097.1 NADPH-ferredoxin reductase FprA [Mycobacterium montefiorense]GKU33753.1 NADPH-ferredoxin reductase FprA [Mycobacterium montefiorense]GKU39873.1 NADPH-ferredoxin reductase FprA [Mycobacterium montefiorense]GKU43678.1 NADPH-ferredoxin reductase FprA [Mycobacterium montefiorense]GKU53310.1 NADPH-ferredoxin reductase FprA [Mycobacterium montefiorense]